jgi:hypothetical protein
MLSDPSYDAVKVGRENYKLLSGDKEYVFIYFVVINPRDMVEGIDTVLTKYQLHKHMFVSATYDLTPLNKRGLETKTIGIIKRSDL